MNTFPFILQHSITTTHRGDRDAEGFCDFSLTLSLWEETEYRDTIRDLSDLIGGEYIFEHSWEIIDVLYSPERIGEEFEWFWELHITVLSE